MAGKYGRWEPGKKVEKDFTFDNIGSGLSSKDLGFYQESIRRLSQQLLTDASRSGFDIGRVLRALPIGDPAYSYSNLLYGINHRHYIPTIPVDKINKGYVFFTRPQLNFGDRNISNNSTFIALSNTNYLSPYRYIRCLLDPRIASGASVEIKQSSKQIRPSPYLNQNMIFMTLLTNTIKSLSGWPDPNMPTYTSRENMRGGVHRMVDGILQTYGSYELSCTFRNHLGNPLLAVIWYWLNYMSAVYDGTVMPYVDMLAANEIDYNTRIWRLVMDEENRYVRMIGATGASFPVSTDIGKFFNLNDTEDLVTDHQELTVTFACVGATYLETVLVDEFNKAVCIGMPEFMTLRNLYLLGFTTNEVREKCTNLEKIPQIFVDRFNYRGYPFINYNTMELEWWVSKTDIAYKSLMRELQFAEETSKAMYRIDVDTTDDVDMDEGKEEIGSGDNPEAEEKVNDQKPKADWSPPRDPKHQKDVFNAFAKKNGLNNHVINPHKVGTPQYKRWESQAAKGFPDDI